MRFPVIYSLISLVLLITIDHAIAAVVGIDYGQQYLKAMVVSPQAPMELILTPESKRKDISGLAIRKIGNGRDDIERFFGSSVGSLVTRFPKDTLLHLKPLLGKTMGDMNDITYYLKEHPGVEISETDRGSLAFQVYGTEYSIEELAAMNIQEVINRANALLKEKDPTGFDFVDRLSVTVPEFFTQHQRKSLLDVGAITADGLQTCLVSDSLSVLINFAFKHRNFEPGKKQYYIVYDMGGGSTKASLFSIEQPLNETQPLVLELGGYGFNDRLGGSKFTLDVANLIENKFLEYHKNIRTDALHANPKGLAKIIQAAEKAKIVLSANSETSVSIEALMEDVDFKTVISRAEFEDFIQESFEEVVEPIKSALSFQYWDDKIDLEELTGVILTGGSSRIPVVQEQLVKLVPEEKILRSVNADESAVNGATIRGTKLFNSFKTKPLDIIDRSIFDYGIRIKSGSAEEIVFAKGCEYPSQKTITLDYFKDGSGDLTIDLYENDQIFKTVALDSKEVKKTFSSKACSSGIHYNVTFSLSQNRLFDIERVEAICKSSDEIDILSDVVDKDSSNKNITDKTSKSGSPRSIKLSVRKTDVPLTHMSLDEKYRVRKHITYLMETDKDRFELEAAKNSLESLLYETREYLETLDVLENGPKHHLERLAELIPDYLEWLEESDTSSKDDIEKKVLEIKKLRNKIDTYLKYLTVPLDNVQFESMIDQAHNLTQSLTATEQQINETLKLTEVKFADFDVDVTTEYHKISLPSYISKILSGWNETFSNLEKNIEVVTNLIDSGLIGKTERESLLEVKLNFDEALIDFENKINAFTAGRDYRFRELLSMAQRLEKAKRRKEERLKRSTMTTNATIVDASFSTIEDTSDPTRLSSSITDEDSEKPTTSVFHDEL